MTSSNKIIENAPTNLDDLKEYLLTLSNVDNIYTYDEDDKLVQYKRVFQYLIKHIDDVVIHDYRDSKSDEPLAYYVSIYLNKDKSEYITLNACCILSFESLKNHWAISYFCQIDFHVVKLLLKLTNSSKNYKKVLIDDSTEYIDKRLTQLERIDKINSIK